MLLSNGDVSTDDAPESAGDTRRPKSSARSTRNVPTRWEILVYAVAIAAGLAVGYFGYTSVIGGGPAQQASVPASEYRTNAIRGFSDLNAAFAVFGESAKVAELASSDETVRNGARTRWSDASKRMAATVASFRGLRPPEQYASANSRLLKMVDFSEKYFAAIATLLAKVDAGQISPTGPAFATELGAINAMKQAWWGSPDLAAANAALEELKAAK